MTQQHYRITLKDAIAHYQAGDLTAKGLVHFYLKIKLKAGWKLRLNHKEVCKELGIQKTAFYNAISRLKVEGSINWEAPEGILVSINSTFRECGNDSANAESESATAECQSAIAESEFASAESKSPKPPSDNHCGDPPDSLTNSYQIFINSLSEGERENFLSFVKQQTKNLNQPINDLEAWLASTNKAGQNRWEVYYNNFLADQPQLKPGSSVPPKSNPSKIQELAAQCRIKHASELSQQRIAAERALEEKTSETQSSSFPTVSDSVKKKLASLLDKRKKPPVKKPSESEESKQWKQEIEEKERRRIDALWRKIEEGQGGQEP